MEESQPRETCDGGYACLAVEHVEGCFTGEGDPAATKGLYVARLRAENERYAKALTRIQDVTSAARSIARAALAASPSPGPEEQA